jgi:hypothetical protein
MLLYIGQSSATESLSPCPFCRAFIIDTHGCDFRKGHGSYLVTVTLTQSTMFELSLGLNDKALRDHILDLGPKHQIQKPNLITQTTPFGEFTRLGSQVEMSETPEGWADPILVPLGSSRAEWLPKK